LDRPQGFRYNCWSDNLNTADLPQNRVAMVSQAWEFLLARLQRYVEDVHQSTVIQGPRDA